MGVRHCQAVLLFFCIFMSASLKANVNMAFLSMTEKNMTSNATSFDWDKKVHGYIMSSSSWGEICIQLIAGTLVSKYGGKGFIATALVVVGAVSSATPFIVDQCGWKGMCAGYLIQSVCFGFISPAVHSLLGRWAPLDERTRFGIIVFSGLYVALILTFSLSSFIGASSLGWPWIFYTFGIQCLLFSVVWIIFGANSPRSHKKISVKERDYIEISLQQSGKKKKLNTPWKMILTSKPFLTLVIAQSCAVWGFTVMSVETPSYFKLALGVELQNSGLLMSLGYALALLLVFITSWTSDFAISKGYTITVARKVSNTLGTWLPALCLIIIAFMPAEYNFISIIVMVVMIGLDAINCCGFLVNHVDLSPNFAGLLVSIANCVTSLLTIAAPLMTSVLVHDTKDVKQWRHVYLLSATMYFVGNLFFIVYGSGEKQHWDTPKDSDIKTDAAEGVKLMDLKATNK